MGAMPGEAQLIFKKAMDHLRSANSLASACVLAFAAGEQKFAGEGAFIGGHKASDKGGTETKQSATATALMAKFANELGVPSSIIRQMVATPPTQVVWLDQRDLHSMGVRTLGVNVQPAQIARETVIVVQKPTADATPMIVPAKQATDRQPWSEFIERTIALSAQQNEAGTFHGRRGRERPYLPT